MDLPMTLPHELLMDVRASVERTRRGGALVAAMQRLALAKLTSERMSSLSDSAGYLLEVPQDLMEAIGSLAGWPAERVMRRFARSRGGGSSAPAASFTRALCCAACRLPMHRSLRTTSRSSSRIR